MAIRGRLSEMSLATLVQLACQEGARAQLSVRRAETEALLYFDGGNVVHAALRDGQDAAQGLEGEEVVYRVLTWEDGDFCLEPGVSTPEHTVITPWSVLLMDGLQRRDEEHWDGLDVQQIEEEYQMAENLQDILVELGGQVSGFAAASLTGMDGLGIAHHTNGPMDVDAINAQMTLLIKLVDTTVDKLAAGTMDHGLLTTEKSYMVWRFLPGKSYYVGLAADRRTANLGNMLLMSRIYAERLGKAMPR